MIEVVLGVFGFDRIELGIKERVEELPGLVKRQKNITAKTVNNVTVLSEPVAAVA